MKVNSILNFAQLEVFSSNPSNDDLYVGRIWRVKTSTVDEVRFCSSIEGGTPQVVGVSLVEDLLVSIPRDWNETDTTSLAYIKDKPKQLQPKSVPVLDVQYISDAVPLNIIYKTDDPVWSFPFKNVPSDQTFVDVHGPASYPTTWVGFTIEAYKTEDGSLLNTFYWGFQGQAWGLRTSDLATIRGGAYPSGNYSVNKLFPSQGGFHFESYYMPFQAEPGLGKVLISFRQSLRFQLIKAREPGASQPFHPSGVGYRIYISEFK